MTKYVARIFLGTLLFFSASSYGQEGKLYLGLDAALAASPDSVYRLDLSKSKLDVIPEEILKFKNLEELYLSKNKLTSLPSDFYFENLKIIDLSKNKFTEFPEALCKNTSIEQILMGKNKMESLPECIGDLKELRILDIWFNLITELPDAMTELRKLRSLDMRGMNYSNEFQQKWIKKLPWVKIEFNLGCDCGY